MRVTSDERRVGDPLPSPLPTGEGAGGGGERPVSLAAAVLFFIGLGAGCAGVVAGGLFFWPWLVRAAEWVGWVLGHHPGLVMLVLIGVAAGAFRLSRWVDERSGD